MHVNWFTVIAQIINFIALVWLLSKFLYKPVLNAIEERENKITSQLEDAKVKVSMAEKEMEEFRNRNENFEKEKSDLFAKVIEESEKKRLDLFDETRKESDALRLKLETSMRETLKNSSEKISTRLQQEIFDVSQKVVKDIASTSLEEQSINYFLNRILHLSEEEENHFKNAWKSTSNKILVRSAFNIEESLRASIEKHFEEILNIKVEFRYEILPDLICGIEVVANGFKIGWNFSAYFNSFEKNISELMSEDQPNKFSL